MRVTLVRLSALGDIVHTWPLAAELKHAAPAIRLTWVVEEPLADLVEGHPAVDSVVTVASRRWRRAPLARRTRGEFAALRSSLQDLGTDICLDPQGVLKSAVVCRLTGAPRRIGLARPWRRELAPALAYTETLPVTGDERHIIRTNLEMVRAVGGEPPQALPPPDGRWLLSPAGAAAGPVKPGRPYAVLIPGAGRPHKILAAGLLGEVARGLARLDLATVVAWGPGERSRALEVTAAADSAARLAPPTDLRELADLLGSASLVIGGDTGPVHLAASLGTPTLAVFTATDPARNRPQGTRVAVISAVDPSPPVPSRRVRARPSRTVSPDEILSGARDLLTP